jgi:hypothetical protein
MRRTLSVLSLASLALVAPLATSARAATPAAPVSCAGAHPAVKECTFQYFGLTTVSGEALSVGSSALVKISGPDGRELPVMRADMAGAGGVYRSTITYDGSGVPWGTVLTCKLRSTAAVAAEFSCM